MTLAEELRALAEKMEWHAGEARKWSLNEDTSNLTVHASWMDREGANLLALAARAERQQSPEREAFVEAVESDQPYGQIISDPLASAAMEAMAQSLVQQVKWTDCSCGDEAGTCWYHLDNIERARSVVLSMTRGAYRAMLAAEEKRKEGM